MKASDNIYTIDRIAKELGVSKSTVSRALSGKGRIGEGTAQRIKDYAIEHNYCPNPMTKELVQSKTYNLGVIIPVEEGDFEMSRSPFFMQCISGVCDIASRYNYDVLISMMRESERSQIQKLVLKRKVDGMILGRAIENSRELDFLREKKVPTVVIGPSNDYGIFSVDNPNREASSELTEILLMKGVKKICLIGGDMNNRVNKSRRKGVLEACEALNVNPENIKLYMDIDTISKAENVVENILKSEIDGVICMDDYICNMVLGCLREQRISIPEQIKLASLYDSQQMEYNIPPVSSLKFDSFELGRRACTKVLEAIGEQINVKLPNPGYQVVLRESTK